MALAPGLELRQSQGLVMTPQLQQAIRLLALPNLEVAEFLAEAVAANPLLELTDAPSADVAPHDPPAGPAEPGRTSPDPSPGDGAHTPGEAMGDRPGDSAPPGLEGGGAIGARSPAGPGEQGDDWGESAIDRAESAETLSDHLHRQLGAMRADPRLIAVARAIVGDLDEAGYLTSGLDQIAAQLGVPTATVEAGLDLVQRLDPTGVGARGLAECLALQAREADRHDPLMAALLDSLDLLARGGIEQFRRRHAIDDDDLADMLAELRGYDPKPGLRFGRGPVPIVQPDILVRAAADEGWDVALNPATLPHLVVNRSYYLQLRRGGLSRQARGWLGEKLAEANWLAKALDQRQRTILSVAGELVRRQDGFFRHGVAGLKPLTLRAVAETLGLHESTVSRVASHKHLQCDRGTFELKFFFTSGVGSTGGGEEGASAQAVKQAIRTLIDREDPGNVLSDDVLVALLRDQGYVLARRTVAKYREAVGLPSSVQRRRQKALELRVARSAAGR